MYEASTEVHGPGLRLARHSSQPCRWFGRRLCFDVPHQCFVVRTTVLLLQVGGEAPRANPCHSQGDLHVCHRSTRTGCSVVARNSRRWASGSSATIPCAAVGLERLLGHTFCSFCPEPSRKSTCGLPVWTAATSWIEVEHGAGFKPRRQCETVPCSILERFL